MLHLEWVGVYLNIGNAYRRPSITRDPIKVHIMDVTSRSLLRQARQPLQQFASAAGGSSRHASTYVPPAASSRILPLTRSKPALTTFFTGKPIYENSILELEVAVRRNTRALKESHILPLPPALAVSAPRASWLSATEMASTLATPLRTSQYRRVTSLLNELATLREVARRAGEPEVLSDIQQALENYERAQDEAKNEAQNKDGFIDEHGRSFTKGRRKESSARVWMIRTKPVAESEVPTTEVLINALPISHHLARPSDRELVLRPLRLTGLLGAFNIFAQVTGGGTTGQAGAIALAVARGVAVHRPDLRDVLQKDGLLIRDPRMVERKKTGLAKARKRVSRSCCYTFGFCFFADINPPVRFFSQYTWVKR